MNEVFFNVSIIGLICGAVYLIIKFGLPYLKLLKLDFDADKVVKELYELALAIGDDEQDELTEKIYDVLIDAMYFANSLPEEEVVTTGTILEFVLTELSLLEVEIGEFEYEVLKGASEIIDAFLKK